MKSPVVRAPTPQGVLHDTMSIFQLQPCSHYSAFCPISATPFCLDCIYLFPYLSLFLVSMLYKCGKLQLFTSLLQRHGGSWALIRPTLDRTRTSRPAERRTPMLPCQSQCPSYHSGCHKSCACWKAFQERQRLQRQAKKKYLKFYGALCAQSLRQLTAGQSRRPAW